MDWTPNLSTKEEIDGLVSDLLTTLPEQLGIDEVISGCEVTALPAGAPPKYITVALGGSAGAAYHQDVLYRGGITGLMVGDFVTVIHLREGNRYEVMGPGGAAGAVVDGAPVDAHYVTTQADPTLTNEHVIQAGDGTDPAIAAGTLAIDVDCSDLLGSWIGEDGANNFRFQPDNPVTVTLAGVVTEHANIQAAITAAAACDTVLIPPGTYNEDITLKNGVCVKGFGPRDKIRITGDEQVVITAGGGWLENVTIVATDPPAGGTRTAVNVSHAAGDCHFTHVRIEATSTANLCAICGMNTVGVVAGTLTADDIEIEVSNTVAGVGNTYGIRCASNQVLELKNFKIAVSNTGAAAGNDSYGLFQTGSADIEATEGWLDVAATGAGTATDFFGTIERSEIVGLANNTFFSQDLLADSATDPNHALNSRVEDISGDKSLGTYDFNPNQVIVPDIAWALGVAATARDDFFRDNMAGGTGQWSWAAGCTGHAFSIDPDSWLLLRGDYDFGANRNHAVVECSVTHTASAKYYCRFAIDGCRHQDHRIGMVLMQTDLKKGCAWWFRYDQAAATTHIIFSVYLDANAWLSHANAKTSNVAYTTGWTDRWTSAGMGPELGRPEIVYVRPLHNAALDAWVYDSCCLGSLETWASAVDDFTPAKLYLFVEGNLVLYKEGKWDWVGMNIL